MIEIRIHGRGGQGAVVASKILATAVFSEGNWVQAFPAFGVERRGAPVAAFVRIDHKVINLRSQIYEPDHIIVLDSTLFNNVPLVSGLKKGGWILINTKLDPQGFASILKDYRIATVDANQIALRNRLGSASNPIVNTAILGAFVRCVEICSLEATCKAIKEGVPIKAEANALAAEQAYREVFLG